jgi:hypothetical protein
MVFVACHDDDDDDVKPVNTAGEDTENIHLDPNIPLDKTIKIDENSSFNMRHFVTSFNQICILMNSRKQSNKYSYVNGLSNELIFESNCFGKFKHQESKFIHNYTSSGVFTSSNVYKLKDDDFYRYRESYIWVYSYVFDKEGYIVEMHMDEPDSNDPKQILKFVYDEKKLITEAYSYMEGYDEYFSKGIFTYVDYDSYTHANYDNIPKIEKIVSEMEEEVNIAEFLYDDKGNTIKETRTYESEDPEIRVYSYDDKNRLVMENSSDKSYRKNYVYSDTELVIHMLNKEDNKYVDTKKYDLAFNMISTYYYEYGVDDVLDYAVSSDTDPEFCKTNYHRKNYYTGEPGNLKLIGYAILNREEYKNNRKQVDFYDGENKLIYKRKYDDGSSYFYNTSDEKIESSEIQEEWAKAFLYDDFYVFEELTNGMG